MTIDPGDKALKRLYHYTYNPAALIECLFMGHSSDSITLSLYKTYFTKITTLIIMKWEIDS